MKKYALKTFKWFVIAILGLYVVVAIGMFATESLVSHHTKVDDSVESHSKAAHQLQLWDVGADSFQRRLEMIRAAKKTIELEFFIYNVDESSRLLTQALIAKAREGVKIRLLVDFSTPIFEMKPVYARFLQVNGIEVRYYNTSPLYRFVKSQHRSHRKLLIIDDKMVMTGGRNIGDEYFDLSPRLNFLDTDVEVAGPLVISVRKSFDKYWNSEFAQKSESVESDVTSEELEKATSFFLPAPDNHVHTEYFKHLGPPKPQANEKCTDLTFATDFPELGEKNRKVFLAIADALKEAKSSVTAESPYFVIKSGGCELLRDLADRNVKLRVLTNSLASTDAFYSVSGLFPQLDSLAKTGFELHAYRGDKLASQSEPLHPNAKIFTIHSKRAVVDDKTVLIGTYNIDPRSANLNSELMFVCKNAPALAKAVMKSMEGRMALSDVIFKDKEVVARMKLIQHEDLLTQAMFWAAMPLANLFDFLL